MQLVRLTNAASLITGPSGHTFEQLYSQWAKQIASYGDSIDQFAKPYLDHARDICNEEPQDDKYGIYALEENGEYYAFMHLNWAEIPGIKDWTLRINWIQTCPRYEYEDLTPDFIGHAVASILFNADQMVTASTRKCGLIKIRVGNTYDRAYWSVYSSALSFNKVLPNATSYKMAGMWLHITY